MHSGLEVKGLNKTVIMTLRDLLCNVLLQEVDIFQARWCWCIVMSDIARDIAYWPFQRGDRL